MCIIGGVTLERQTCEFGSNIEFLYSNKAKMYLRAKNRTHGACVLHLFHPITC